MCCKWKNFRCWKNAKKKRERLAGGKKEKAEEAGMKPVAVSLTGMKPVAVLSLIHI